MLKHFSSERFRIPPNSILVFLALLLIIGLLLSVFFKPKIGKTENHVVFQEITADTFMNSVMVPIVEVMTGANPTLQVLENRLGTKAVPDEEYDIDVIKKQNFQIIIASTKDGSLLSEVSIYPNFDRFVTFEEVGSVLGAWKAIQESKTSTVLFEKGKATYVYVHLLDPPRFPASRVLSFTVRNLSPPKHRTR